MTAEELHQLVFGKPQWLTDMEEDHRPPVLKKQSVIAREWLPTFLATGPRPALEVRQAAEEADIKLPAEIWEMVMDFLRHKEAEEQTDLQAELVQSITLLS